MDQASNHEHAFANWKERTSEHTARARLDADIFVHDILQGAYPDHYLVRTSPDKSDLLGYAKAGHATAIRNASSGYDATRVYRAPRPRLESSGRLASGKLDDVVNFAVWDYEWRDIDFIVYETAYRNRFMQNVKTLYVLAPQVACTEDAYGCNKQIDSLLLASGEWTSELHEQIWIFDNSQWQKDKLLWRGVQDASWDDVILDSAVKPQLNQDVHGFFDSQALYQRAKIPWKRGIIFHGVPGNGKTLSIKALINSLAARSIPSLYVKNLDACSGPKWSIQKIFQQARRAAPCLLILEDLDSLVGDTTRSYFLNEVDGLESNDGILMIGSTNHLDRLDPAVTKRPSRFDRKYHFKVPTESERLAYCRYWRDKSSDFPDELCPLIASWTEGFSFAYLKVRLRPYIGRNGRLDNKDAADLIRSSS